MAARRKTLTQRGKYCFLVGVTQCQGDLAGARHRPATCVHGEGILRAGTNIGLPSLGQERKDICARHNWFIDEVSGRLTKHFRTEGFLRDTEGGFISSRPAWLHFSKPVFHMRNHRLFHPHGLCKLSAGKPLFFALLFNQFSNVHT